MERAEDSLERFVLAQASTYADALAEIKNGRKVSHWMWFVFPQLKGLGRSSTANHYGIVSLAEARAFLSHPRLGGRILEITAAVNAISNRTAHQIFGSPDDLKFRSSMTLFDLACGRKENAFREALDKYFAGRPDPKTLELLGIDQDITKERIDIDPRSKDSLK